MNSLSKQISLGVILVAAFTAAHADGLIKVEQSVFGMDCAPCAYGLQKGLTKLPGATKVDVSLNEGKATIEFAPDAPTTFSQVHAVIVNGGFTPKDAVVTVAGRITTEGGQLFLVVNADERYRLVFPQATAAADLKAGTSVTVQGGIQAESGSDPVPSITVEKVF